MRDIARLTPPTVKLSDLVEPCLREHDFDVSAAAASLAEQLQDDTLWDALGAEMLYRGCLAACRDRRRAIRSECERGVDYARAAIAGADALGRRIAASREMSLYDWPMSHGGCLGDATREEVAAEAEGYLKEATRLRSKGEWLSAVRDAMRDVGSVRDCLTAEELREMHTQAGVGS